MERAEFVHLVRESEHASEADSNAYRRSVAAFAALGYAWVLGCLLLAAGTLWWMVQLAARGRLHFWFLWVGLAAAGLLWATLRALWCRLEPPEGLRITAEQAPGLFDAIERIRKKVKGPPVHAVYLDAEFNASIGQRPRWGLFGGARNHLTLGLPLLMALDRQRLLAVLAHEYGHLRGDHGRFAAWIYRTRLSWARLHESLDGEGPVAAATQGFLRWYFPRFVAKTFALARQDEYEADRIAGRLVGREVAGAALVEVAVKGAWLGEVFWPAHWRKAAAEALPVGPYEAMRRQLSLPPPPAMAKHSLSRALKRISDVDDTHPVLRDRLEALEVGRGLPAWSQRSALGLLDAAHARRWIAHFDAQWCREHASAWKQHHAYLARVRARVEVLSADPPRNSADASVELGDLQLRLNPDAPVRLHYERALGVTPGHPGALRGLVQCLPATDQPARLSLLDQLYQNSAAHRWWAADTAVGLLEQDPDFDTAALKLWRERRSQAGEAEDRAWEELTGSGCFEAIARHDLSDFEKGELLADLARCQPVSRAWLVRKNLREFPWRRTYVLFVELPRLADGARWELCRALERGVPLPGPVLALWAGESPTLRDIERNAGPCIFVRDAG